MENTDKTKSFNLEDRTYQFAKDAIQLVKRVPRTVSNAEIVKQLVRAAGSIGANYIEASEALGKKDFALHIKISRKEAKECKYWLRLLDIGSAGEIAEARDSLLNEVTELMKIFGSIVEKSK